MTCKHHDGTRCTLGLFGGRPSPGVCAACDKYDGPTRGLGDVIHATLTFSGIAAVAKAIAPDCGCQKRRAALNERFPRKD
jgi:hypothetical protein